MTERKTIKIPDSLLGMCKSTFKINGIDVEWMHKFIQSPLIQDYARLTRILSKALPKIEIIEPRERIHREADCNKQDRDTLKPDDEAAKGKAKKRTRKDNLYLAIDLAIKDLGEKPSLEVLWKYFEDDKDKTGFIVDNTDTHIIWRDKKGGFHDSPKNTLANRLARHR
jgi:hypothetical protein